MATPPPNTSAKLSKHQNISKRGKARRSLNSSFNKGWCVYLIISSDLRKTYVGVTTDFNRRLKQHNGELTGGAKASRAGRPWRCVCLVEGFNDRSEACSFEWSWKQFSRKSTYKVKRENDLDQQEKGYSTSRLIEHRQAALERVKNSIDCSHLSITWQEQQT